MKQFALVPALCLFLAAGAFADDRTQGRNQRAIHPAGDILGLDIRNTRNESLGHVQDIIIRMKDGQCVYVAMARGQVLGFGGNYFAISPDALTMSASGDYLVLDATTQQFENAKGFDQNNWPRQPDPRWGKGGNNANTNNRDNNRDDNNVAANNKVGDDLARISSLQGLYVYGRDDKQLGRVYDLALNCTDHKVAYVAVHHGGTLGIGGKLVAVPWQAMTMKAPALDPQRRAFFLNTTQQDFERAPSFTTDAWPAQPAATFNREGAQP